ncbi:hypothetical protein HMPREF9412_0984 [Paenibacillus sp. HGF5]|nr:hypothetical protein HMPREF9412_0984 [Paenibacillus sp. HGF5]
MRNRFSYDYGNTILNFGSELFERKTKSPPTFSRWGMKGKICFNQSAGRPLIVILFL